MPNWSFNHHAIKGHKADVLKLLNDAIENSIQFRNEFGEPVTAEPQTDVEKAFSTLLEVGCSLHSNHVYNKEAQKDVPVVENHICLSTFRPIPLTFLYYDTTNHASEFPDIANEQKNEYGAVGWYDFNRSIWFGTKWDVELRNFTIHINGDIVTIYFNSDTAWSTPDLWCKWLKEQYPELAVFICANEESGEFYFYQEMDDNPSDWTEEVQLRLDAFDCEHDENDYEKRWEVEDNAIEEMVDEFHAYVADYEL